MSFGGFGGFGQNKPAQSSGFGGFGSSNNNGSPGFGSPGTTAFGTNNNAAPQTTSLFGGSGGGGGFGAGTGGFGQNNNNAFGAKPSGFGAAAATTSSGGLFGASTATAGGTGFGGSGGGFGANNQTSSSPFGSSLFGGGNKPTSAFGSTTAPASSSSLFGGGGGGGTGAAFGGTSGGGFGATNNPGIGAVGDPPGTAQVQFTPFVEKEGTNSSQSNSFQNILFMDPYKKWSTEELRLVDYSQGRRHGNATGAGAFGVGTGFGGGGFGSNQQQQQQQQQSSGFGGTNTGTGTGMFGSSQPANTGFGGAASSNTGGFGGGTGGSLFGANKPAAGGIFGGGGGSTSQPAQTGGLFAGGNTGFGAGSSTGGAFGGNTGTGSGMFGANANQSKPSGFGFGNTSTSTGFGGAGGSSGAFGSTNTGGTGTGGLFGTTGQGNTTSGGGGGLFGSAGQQQGTTSGFGGNTGFGAQNQNTGGSLFGNQNKPSGGLFGTTGTPGQTGNTGGGMFNTNNTSSPFGAANNTQNQGGGLFGNKPAGTGTGAFGSSTAGQTGNTGGGLFGGLGANNQNQQPGQGSLFGGLGQSQAQKPSPFGSTGQTGGGMFGNQNAQQSGSLFGNNPQQPQQQQGGLGGSLFGASQNTQAPQSLSTSINDISAYGSASLFSNLGNAEPQNPGPLATPLSGNKSKAKSRSILPMYKLSPANASRFGTPQNRGFGFSYSTYGSPATPSSVSSTPGGFNHSLLGGSIGRNLGKSISTSNLRRSFNVEDSILTPGAFSTSSNSRLHGPGSHKKLIINREMRSDLFASPNKEKQTPESVNGPSKLSKRVSFDTSVPAIENGDARPGSQSPDTPVGSKDLGYLHPTSRAANGATNGARPASVPATPEMEQVKGNELAIVHEEEAAPVAPAVTRQSETSVDKEPGSYWMQPTKEEILEMNRMQRQKVPEFIVGRENVGSIRFKVPVDLSNIDPDHLFDEIVILEPRSATVYPIAAKKPPVGKGLNVPSQISLEQSWPRAKDKRTPLQDKSGSRFNKHVERLKRIPDTTFESYDRNTGVWTFSVEHFTTYGLEYDDDETDGDLTAGTAAATASATATLTAPTTVQDEPSKAVPVDTTLSPEIDPDDTFDFKRNRRALPGAFDDGTTFSDDDDMAESDQLQHTPPQEAAEPEMLQVEPSLPQGPLAGQEEYYQQDETFDIDFEHSAALPGPVDIWRENAEAGGSMSREEGAGAMEEDGSEFQLSRVVPSDQVPAGIMRARMRAIKKSSAPTHIQVAGGDDWMQVLQESVRTPRRMNRAELRALNESGAAWEVEDQRSPTQNTQAAPDGLGFATSLDMMKSLFDKGPSQPVQASPAKGFVKWPYQRRSKIAHEEDGLEQSFRSAPHVSWGPRETIVTASNSEGITPTGRVTMQVASTSESHTKTPDLQTQINLTEIDVVKGVPAATLESSVSVNFISSEGEIVWELASVLFDDDGVNLSAFWQRFVENSTNLSIARATTHEEKALACIAGHRVVDACKHLLEAKNFRLATLVSTIGSEKTKRDIRVQLKDWKESNVLSDFSEPIRAIYELLAGNACACTGLKSAPIENRVSSFVISERFGFDWMQSFGLRLWCGSTNSITDAIHSFQNDIAQDREPEPDNPLWSLLKLYADRSVDHSDCRLDWQLSRALYASGKVSFGQNAAERLDVHTLSFASELTAAGSWVSAIFVLLHLSDPVCRSKAIREQLGRHAHLISTEENNSTDNTFTTLTQTFKLPARWIWEAKALYARSVDKDAVAEFTYLILAQDFVEANRTFLKRVAPTAVLERRYDDLFQHAQLLYAVRDKLPNWAGGGAVYLLFPAARNWNGLPQLPDWIDELTHGLGALRAATADDDVLEVAAIADMAEDLVRLGVRVHRRHGDPRLYKLAASLPLTGDKRQKYLKDLVFEGMAQIGVH